MHGDERLRPGRGHEDAHELRPQAAAQRVARTARHLHLAAYAQPRRRRGRHAGAVLHRSGRARDSTAGRHVLRRRRLPRRRLSASFDPRHTQRIRSMRSRSLALLLAGVSATVLSGQARLPPDIHEKSLSRLPPVERASLDEDGKRIWDCRGGHARHAGHGAGAADDVQPQSRCADPRAQSVPADHGGGPALLRAVGADRGTRIRSAVPNGRDTSRPGGAPDWNRR